MQEDIPISVCFRCDASTTCVQAATDMPPNHVFFRETDFCHRALKDILLNNVFG